ncbi:hypothetical protein ACSQ67_011415 [Phaseolus vulgaris]
MCQALLHHPTHHSGVTRVASLLHSVSLLTVSRLVFVLDSLCVFRGVRGGGVSSPNECGGGGDRARRSREW